MGVGKTRPFRTSSLSQILLGLWLMALSTTGFSANNQFLVLNYHDIIEVEERVPPFDRVAVCQEHLEGHFAWLKSHGYQVISVQDLIDASEAKKNLPDKAVLLTFDDGYQSFYTRVFPLLKRYHYPALVALVGSWMDQKPDSTAPKDKALLTWDQVRELSRSGLVEVASHSYDLHRGLIANPQGNEQPAATAHVYDTDLGQYEDDEEYRQRILNQVAISRDFIWQNAGIAPRVMVWPFGEYNETTLEAARLAGMPYTMALRDGINTLADLRAVRRLLISDDPNVQQFEKIVTAQRGDRPQRIAHIDLDFIYDKDGEQLVRNLDALIERVRAMGITTVYLEAFSDPDGDGNADALYFPNRHLPVRSDLFNRVAWQLKTRSGVKVFAWMPMMAYKADVPDDWRVMEWREGKAEIPSHIYTRLSPLHPDARRWVGDLYEDLGKFAAFDGILFHDDGILSDYEDVSPRGLRFAKEVWGLSDDFGKLHDTPAHRLAWARGKSELMLQYTDYLTQRARFYRPLIKTARNIYALPILQPESEEWYAQTLKGFLKHYDYAAIEAMPYMEKASKPEAWLKELITKVAKEPLGLKKSVFELQTVDWNTQKPIPMEIFQKEIKILKDAGVQHIGYYPDNPYDDQPKLETLKKHFSVEIQP